MNLIEEEESLQTESEIGSQEIISSVEKIEPSLASLDISSGTGVDSKDGNLKQSNPPRPTPDTIDHIQKNFEFQKPFGYKQNNEKLEWNQFFLQTIENIHVEQQLDIKNLCGIIET